MKKKYLIGFVLLFFPKSFVWADDFSFQTLYTDTYEKISTVDEEELFSRVESDFSDEVEKEVVEGNLPKEFLDELAGYIKVQKAVDLIQGRYDFELVTLLFEEDLVDSLLKAPIFSNELVEDGQFDLVYDLNLIDLILFGEKSEETEPTFAEESSQAFDEGSEAWQIGDDDKKEESSGLAVGTEMGSNTDSAYGEGDTSIAGNLDGIKKALITLGSKPLEAECHTSKDHQPASMDTSLSDMGNLGMISTSTPPSPKNKPEVLENEKQDVYEQFKGIEQHILNEEPCGFVQNKILRNTGLDRSVSFSLEFCENLRDQTADRLLEGIYKTGELMPEKQHGFRISAALDQWNLHFKAFLEEVTKMQEYLEEISKKPIKY